MTFAGYLIFNWHLWQNRNFPPLSVDFKGARPSLSLTIPTLFEHGIRRCLKRSRKSGYTYLKGIDWRFKKVFFFEIDEAIATQWRHCYFYFSLICKKSRHSFLKLFIWLVVHIIVFSCTDLKNWFMRAFKRNNWLQFLAPANKWNINNSFRVPQTDVYPDHGKKTLASNCF